MVAFGDSRNDALAPLTGWDGGNSLGKRYTEIEDKALEVLVTKAGVGTLGNGHVALVVKESKPLPSSD
ncbi:hypothetical protein M1E17_09810 [Arthrobacter sp. D1-29]